MEGIIPVNAIAIGLGIAAGFVVSFQTLETGKNWILEDSSPKRGKGFVDSPQAGTSATKRKRGRPPKSRRPLETDDSDSDSSGTAPRRVRRARLAKKGKKKSAAGPVKKKAKRRGRPAKAGTNPYPVAAGAGRMKKTVAKVVESLAKIMEPKEKEKKVRKKPESVDKDKVKQETESPQK